MPIHIGPRKQDVKTLSLDIIKRNGLTVKFKVKLFNKGFNDIETLYHQEYVYNQNKQMNINVNVNLNPFIQFSISDDNYKEILIMTEVSRLKFMRKSSKLIGLIEAYESDDIDIISVDASGTHIMSCFRNESSCEIKMNKKIVKISAVMREDTGDVGILFSIENSSVVLSVYDFLDMIYKIRSINFLDMGVKLISYLGMPELGENITDFRNDVSIRYDAEEELNIYGGGKGNTGDFDGLKSDSSNKKVNTKLFW